MKKQTIKEFVKENKGIIVTVTLSTIAGMVIGYKMKSYTSIPFNTEACKKIKRVFDSIPKGRRGAMFTGVCESNPIKVEDMGELGKRMIDCKIAPEQTFSQFILFEIPKDK